MKINSFKLRFVLSPRYLLALGLLLWLGIAPAHGEMVWTTVSLTDGVHRWLCPNAIAVNPAGNKIYVANYWGNDVSVIDGQSNTLTATVPAGTHPVAIAVNPVTGKIYVANQNSNNMNVIDGADANNATVTVADANAMGPIAIAVNPATNEIHLPNVLSSQGTM